MELELHDLRKHFKDKKAVDGVNLKLTPGVWGLLGANGAGKTTVMRMVAGISTPTAGKVFYDGMDIRMLGQSYRGIFGYLPQSFGYYPEFTVKDYLQYVGALKGMDRGAITKKMNELLEVLTLSDVKGKQIRKLSGGMRRRVGIAQALLNDPEILILDEPTSGLDPGERVRLRNILSEFGKDRVVLISTHIVSDVEYVATKNAVMKDGKIIAMGTTDELLASMEGKVWTVQVPLRELPIYEKKNQVVNVRNEDTDIVSIRYLAEMADISGSEAVQPRLEDLYLWLFPNRREEAER